MEFKAFLNAFMQATRHIVRTGRRSVYRLLTRNPWQAVSLRGVDSPRVPSRC